MGAQEAAIPAGGAVPLRLPFDAFGLASLGSTAKSAVRCPCSIVRLVCRLQIPVASQAAVSSLPGRSGPRGALIAVMDATSLDRERPLGVHFKQKGSAPTTQKTQERQHYLN